MGVTYNKNSDIKYTEMCQYIDANMQYTKNTGEYPAVESTIFQYLYHILYALSYKECYFQRKTDYDEYALYAAGELYTKLKSRYVNEGKIVRGKEIIPIRNTLDFIKATMIHLKTDFQRFSFATVINPEAGHDTSILEHDMKESIRADYRPELLSDLEELLEQLPAMLHKVINNTPYRNDKLFCKKLYISCLLTMTSDITIPNKLKNKSKSKISEEEKFLSYRKNVKEVILWHLDEEYSDYVRLLVNILNHRFTDKLNEIRTYDDLSDEFVDSIMKSAYSTYDTRDGED